MSRMLEISFEEKLFLINSASLANTPAGYCIIKQNGILVNAPMGSVTTIIFDTIAEVEALDSSYRLVYCKETNTFYEFDATSGETVDSEFILNTSVGGSTRWVGVSGEFTRILTNFFDGIQFGLTPINTTPAEGKLLWNSDDGTLELGLPGGNVALQIGEETLIRVKKATGQTILNGDVVYISGASGQRAEVSLADADSYNTSFVLGVATEDIGTLGYVTLTGLVRGINTLGMTEGSPIWLSQTAGKFTTTRPTAPAESVFIGYVIYEHATEGIISVRPQIVPRLIGLSDVYTETPTANEILQYNATNSRFELTDTPTFSSLSISNAPVNNTDAVNKLYADNLVVGLWDDRGSYDASGNTFPTAGGSGTAGAILKGDIWTISVAGTLGGVAVDVGDTVRAVTDTPGQTASNWALLENNIGYVPENTANKATTMTGNSGSNILYLTAKAIYDWSTGLFQTLSNLRTSFQATPDDTHYPSEKLVKDSLDAKQDTLSKASGSDIDTGTDDTKYVTSKSIADSKLSFTDGTETLTNKTIDLDDNTILNAGNVLIGENLLENSNFRNVSTYGYGVIPENWAGYLAYVTQGAFPKYTKQQALYDLDLDDSELKGLWNLNEDSGDAADLSSNNTTLSNDNFATVQNYLMRNSRQSTVNNQYLYTYSIANLLPGSELLWGLNFRYGQLNKDGELIGFDNGVGTLHYLKVVSNKIVFGLNGLSANLTSDVILEQDKSYHIVAGYASNTLYLWINGILKTASVTGSINNTGLVRFTVGAGLNSGTCFGTYQNVFITSAFRGTPYIKRLWFNCGYQGIKVLPSTPAQGTAFQQIRKGGAGSEIFNRLYGKHFTLKAKMYQFVAETGYIACADYSTIVCQSALTSVINDWVDVSVTYLGDWSDIVGKIDVNLLCTTNSTQVYYKDVMLYEGTTPVAFWNASQNDWRRFPRLMRMDPPADLNGGYHFEENRWYNFTPIVTAGGSMTISGTFTDRMRYKFQNKELDMLFNLSSFTLGGTAYSEIYITSPIPFEDYGARYQLGRLYNNNQNSPCFVASWNIEKLVVYNSTISNFIASGNNNIIDFCIKARIA